MNLGDKEIKLSEVVDELIQECKCGEENAFLFHRYTQWKETKELLEKVKSNFVSLDF